jgi:hypothetical protein
MASSRLVLSSEALDMVGVVGFGFTPGSENLKASGLTVEGVGFYKASRSHGEFHV